MKSFDKDGDRLSLRFTYDPDILRFIRRLKGSRWHRQSWSCAALRSNARLLENEGFSPTKDARAWLHTREDKAAPRPTVRIPGFRGKLLPYQNDGVAWLLERNGRGLLADEMGLGKTVQALAYMQSSQRLPALVVCPASLKINWEREVLRFTTLRPCVIIGTRIHRLPNADVYIANYDILHHWGPALEKKFQTVVVDEAHYIKNRKAKRSRAAAVVIKGARSVIALTGTPVVNRPVEFFNVLRLLKPDLFPNFWDFAERYCGARHNGFGWDFSGATHVRELHRVLTKNVMLRRLKADVYTELPAKRRSVVPLELSNAFEYRAAEANVAKWTHSVGASAFRSAAGFAKVESLKQVAVECKMKAVQKWLLDWLEDTDDKIIVFARHLKVLDTLGDILRQRRIKYVRVSGSTKDRMGAVDKFNDNPAVRVFLGQFRAAGEGLNLTAAGAVAFAELGWSPAEHDQMEDRAHRIGQTKCVNVYYLIGVGTVEENIAAGVDKKRKVINGLVDGRVSDDDELIGSLLQGIRMKGNKR